MHHVLRTDLASAAHAAGGSGAPSGEMMRLRGASMARYVSRYNSPVTARPIRLALVLGYLTRVAQQLVLTRDPARAREHWAYVVGLLTGRASVAGTVVTDRR